MAYDDQTFYLAGWLVYVVTLIFTVGVVSGGSRGRGRRGLRWVYGVHRKLCEWVLNLGWLVSTSRCLCIPWNAPAGARHTKESHRHDCTPTPPCGGCSRCIAQQYWYYEGNKINV